LTSSNLRFVSRQKDKKTAATDARQGTYPRWHDMAAGASVKREKTTIPLWVYGKVVILQAEINRGTVR
jgi:hypothetical protein